MGVIWLGSVGGLVVFCFISISGQSSGSQSSYSSFDYGTSCEGNTSSIADGVCDISVNTASCGYDGGDCCECTCIVHDVPCNRTVSVFDCHDPDASTDCSPTPSPTASPTSAFAYSACVGYVGQIQDGYCNEANNNADCGYDGGDCCSCTCVNDLEFPCGEQGGGFDCRDPDVPPECTLIGTSCEGNLAFIQDLYCDSSLNNLERSYDGGDCCICTCVDVVVNSSSSASTSAEDDDGVFFCGDNGFDCLDPSVPAECSLEDGAPTPSPKTIFPFPECGWPTDNLADGKCDEATNSLACDWDGGDCCQCTCVDTEDHICEESECLNPDAPTDCETKISPEIDNSGCEDPQSIVSDGRCNAGTNTAVCGWDGGDCCERTCTDNTFSCGEAGYSCLDPTQDCAPSVSVSTATNESLSRGEVVGALIASVVGYCFLGGVIVVSLAFINRKCRKKTGDGPAGATVVPRSASMRAKRARSRRKPK